MNTVMSLEAGAKADIERTQFWRWFRVRDGNGGQVSIAIEKDEQADMLVEALLPECSDAGRARLLDRLDAIRRDYECRVQIAKGRLMPKHDWKLVRCTRCGRADVRSHVEGQFLVFHCRSWNCRDLVWTILIERLKPHGSGGKRDKLVERTKRRPSQYERPTEIYV